MIICPRCGKETFYVYRSKRTDDFAGCEHCAELLNENYGPYDAECYPEDYAPPKIVCPKCGEFCRKVYRTARYGDFIGCDVCVSELNAVQDADVAPEEYGLEAKNE